MAMEIRCRIPEAHELTVLCVAFNSFRNEVYSGSQDCFIKLRPRFRSGMSSPGARSGSKKVTSLGSPISCTRTLSSSSSPARSMAKFLPGPTRASSSRLWNLEVLSIV